jgi:hypothetical protein
MTRDLCLLTLAGLQILIHLYILDKSVKLKVYLIDLRVIKTVKTLILL